jgi:hypothetical protein
MPSKKAKSTKKARTTKKARATGSQKLRAARGGSKSAAAALDILPRFIASLNRSRIIHDILIRGIPFPDVIKGSFTVRNASAATSTLNTLLGIRNVEYKPIKLFPKGIPVIDEIRLEIEGKLRR